MTLLLLSALLSLFAAHADRDDTPTRRDATDYLARTTWVCLMPPHDAYEAHRCGPSALTRTCTATWLAECERQGGAVRPCGTDGCPDVYVGKRADRAAWERRRISALRSSATPHRARQAPTAR